jgi:hypothetical protein
VAAARRPFIQKEYAVVRQRHVAGHRHLPAADQPRIGDRVVGGTKRPRRDDRGAVAGAPGDAMEAGGLEGFGERHRRQDGGEPPRQPRLPSPRGAEQEEVMVKIPASPAVSRVILQRCAARTPELAVLVSATPVTSYGASLMYSRCV